MTDERVREDFDVVLRVLPSGWQEKAKELGALRRCRKIASAEVLLRLLLIHLAEGCSLRETAALGKEGGLADLSDVAIMDRLRQSGAWFQWMNQAFMHSWVARQPEEVYGKRWNLRLVDGTFIKEPGPTGSSWRVHYSIGLPSLACDELVIAPHGGRGESFKRFAVHKGDLFIGDRAYGVRPSIFHVTEKGGDVLTRFAMSNLPLTSPKGARFSLLPRLRRLRTADCGDWPVVLEDGGNHVQGRVCAIRRSRQAAEQARKKVVRQAQKQGVKAQAATLEAAGYVYVFTTVSADELDADGVLEMYRGRWQIELVFKRLKSILGLGHLRKIDQDSACAWLQGKLFVAFLVETLMRHAETFFPWGYPVALEHPAQPMPMA